MYSHGRQLPEPQRGYTSLTRPSSTMFLRAARNGHTSCGVPTRKVPESCRWLGRLAARKNCRASVTTYAGRCPSGIAAGLWAAARHGDISGLLKAGAIVAGVVSAGIGVLSEMLHFAGTGPGGPA